MNDSIAAAVVGDMGDSSAVRETAEARAGVEGGICCSDAAAGGPPIPVPAKGLATPVLVVNPAAPPAAPALEAEAAAGGMSIAGGAGGTAEWPVRLGVTTSGDDSALAWLLDDRAAA